MRRSDSQGNVIACAYNFCDWSFLDGSFLEGAATCRGMSGGLAWVCFWRLR
jgi:hypothetical protein